MFRLLASTMSPQLFVAVIFALFIDSCLSFSCSVGPIEDKSLNGGTYTCATILIEGTLRIQSNTHITADRIEVASTGKLIVGTSNSPVSNVVIYLNHAMGYNHLTDTGTPAASGQLMSYGETYIYGQDKTSWTLLNTDCDSCSQIHVDECTNWSIGDRIVVVTTGNGATDIHELWQSADNFRSEERIITSVSSDCTITLDSALSFYHRYICT